MTLSLSLSLFINHFTNTLRVCGLPLTHTHTHHYTVSILMSGWISSLWIISGDCVSAFKPPQRQRMSGVETRHFNDLELIQTPYNHHAFFLHWTPLSSVFNLNGLTTSSSWWQDGVSGWSRSPQWVDLHMRPAVETGSCKQTRALLSRGLFVFVCWWFPGRFK